jgi:hypothetical protein
MIKCNSYDDNCIIANIIMKFYSESLPFLIQQQFIF